ncbi:MAG: class I SAM-dependent methyltransferase [Pseudomonadota bacterium]
MTSEVQNHFLRAFEDPDWVQSYSDGPVKFTPGFLDVHKMVNILLQERVPKEAQILVHGAGGGLELEALADVNPTWRFVGVDPSKPMLDVAEARLAPVMDRVTMHHGFIESAPTGPFDGATSLLTLHFLEASERIDTVRKIVGRLKPGAPFVAVHTSLPAAQANKDVWWSRYQAFAIASGVDPDRACQAREAVASMPTVYDAHVDIQILEDAGLIGVSTFYSAFTWRGWIGYAA